MFITETPVNARGRLTPGNAEIIKQTLPLVGANITKITPIFYEKMFAAHPELIADTFNRGNQKSGEQQKALAASIATFAAMLVDDNAPDPVDMLSRIGHKHVSLGIVEDQYPIVHDNLFAAIVEVLGEDVVTPEVAAAWDEVYWLMAKVLIDYERELYRSAGVADGEVFTTAEIISRKQLPAEAMEFTIRPDEMTEKFMDALPGQYTSIGVRLPDGARQLRQYSLVDVDKETGCIRIAVQRDGEVSSFLMDSLSDGDRVDATLPAGDLVLDDSNTPVVLVSQGIGSTPMVGMLSALAAAKSERTVVVLHADSSAQDHAQRDLQESLSAQIGATYNLFYRESGQRMNLGELMNEGVLPTGAHWYLCGGTSFLQDIREQIADGEQALAPEKVAFELFSPNDWLIS
ncbi:MAG TPA: globin domain-containing protein [Corynebacterium urealyticum]|nr:globin domain-containing protein [Corynebacterium urealyticum]